MKVKVQNHNKPAFELLTQQRLKREKMVQHCYSMLSWFLFFLFTIATIRIQGSYQRDLKRFLKDCSTEETLEQKCTSSKASFILWLLQRDSRDKAVSCLMSQLKQDKISAEQKNQHWLLLSKILKSTKCSKLALKLVNLKEKVKLFSNWSFLGPFQIGKQELDGQPFVNNKTINNRWNKKYKTYSELVKTGIVKWTDIDVKGSDTIQLNPGADWNDLVMSMQSMAMTEWQGILINDFMVASPNLNLKVQCLGVNSFFINNVLMNGDVYHRKEFW